MALTFTNKAVGEMKSRILDSLYLFGQENPENRGPLFKELCRALGISPQQLQQRSRSLLQRILHNYSFFEISTIDKFNHKIIKTFARDLQLSQNFEVELDTELLLQEAVGRVLERAGKEEALTNALIAFSLEKIAEDKSWDISRDLVEIGKLLFQEDHAENLEKLTGKEIADFKEIQKKILDQIKKLEVAAQTISETVLQEIHDQGFEPDDFPRKTLPNHFNKILGQTFETKVLYANKLEEALVNGKILKASDKRDSTILCAQILEHYNAIKRLLFQRNYLKNCYGNIVPLSLLNEIGKELKQIELDKEVIPISALNSLLSKEVKNQPAPFIYERMGEKYRHYFIDEFQDTSKLQWENLVPLISNALESVNDTNEQGSLFLVGDVKQAIYRWRGGKAEQLLNLINLNSNPFYVAPELFALETNWRSHSQIIDFNNRFFGTISPYFKNGAYQQLFTESSQKTNDKNGGLVHISFLDSNSPNKDMAFCAQTLERIREVKNHNFDYGDICILVRKNDHGTLLANYLSENQVPVVSSESLLLKNDRVVVFLIALLQYLDNPSHQEAVFQLLLFLSSGQEHRHAFIASHKDNLDDLLFNRFDFNVALLKSETTLTILDHAITKFDLVNESQAYLIFLLDEALEMEQKEGPGINSFLKHWERKKDKLSITAPEQMEAVKIMTIHKSKGLEFPVVLFPFANAMINDPRKQKKAWVAATAKEATLELPHLLVNYKKEMMEYNAVAAQTYVEELDKTELDALNVLYVAMTRAEKALYVISERSKPIASLEQCNSYSDLLQYYVQDAAISEIETGNYVIGSLPNQLEADKLPSHTKTIQFKNRSEKGTSFEISTRSVQLWDDSRRESVEMGNLIHFAMSKVGTKEDVPKVINEITSTGELPIESAPYVAQKMKEIVGHPQLSSFYSTSYEVRNEQELLLTSGKILRPDRIMLRNNKASVIDYKTGKKAPSHKEQIVSYADALKDMGYTIEHIIIIYIDNQITPLFL